MGLESSSRLEETRITIYAHMTEFKVEIGLSDGVYITESTNIPGLVLESNSLDDLKEALYDVVPRNSTFL